MIRDLTTIERYDNGNSVTERNVSAKDQISGAEVVITPFDQKFDNDVFYIALHHNGELMHFGKKLSMGRQTLQELAEVINIVLTRRPTFFE